MSLVTYVDRRNTDCSKWDAQSENFGEEGLHAMWVADMDFQVPSCVTDALTEYVKEGVFGYYTAPDSYYNAFINWEKEHGYDVKREWIRFSPGVVSGFNWIVQMMTNPKDPVIVLTPVYYPFLYAVTNNDRTLITSDLINDHGTYSIDFEDFEQKIIDNHVKLFIFCSPHNPVGRVWKKEELDKLVAICKKHHVFIISDEIHHDLLAPGQKHIPIASIADYDDNLITVTAPSKTFNLAGCQNSIIIIPDEKLREKWDAFTTSIRVTNGNTFGYIAARAAYTGGRPWLNEVNEIVHNNYLYVKETFEKELPKLVVSPLEGTYLLWIDFGSYLSFDEMKDFMQKKCHLAFDYGDWFGGEKFGTHVRMNLATSKENVEKAVTAIIENLK